MRAERLVIGLIDSAVIDDLGKMSKKKKDDLGKTTTRKMRSMAAALTLVWNTRGGNPI
jgi:polyhydroxyalkanoate synthesis regulator phasin